MSNRADQTAAVYPDTAFDVREMQPHGDLLTRCFSWVLAFAVLVFLMPLMVVTALAVKLNDGGPILFAHPRIGHGGKIFPCFKFRTMVTDADLRLQALLSSDPAARAEWEESHKLRSDPRVTLIGDFLRKSSIDELPQLFNILRGEMNVVGPRPIVLGEVSRYGRRIEFYKSVKPGLTGLWQILGRSDTTYRRRVAIDTFYARNQSFLLDLTIIVRTVPAVVKRKGSY